MLTARQLKIIKLIMNNPGIHGKEISENLNVSTRTIRNEITFMNDVTNCILIRSSTKQGYMINDEHLDIIHNIVNQDNENMDLAVYRIYKIIGKILFFEDCSIYDLSEIIYVFLTIFLYLLKCPQSLILSALRVFCFCGKPHISRLIFLYFLYQTWLKSW